MEHIDDAIAYLSTIVADESEDRQIRLRAATTVAQYRGPDCEAHSSYALAYLKSIMLDESEERAIRMRAAITLAQYQHSKRPVLGKKEERQAAAAARSEWDDLLDGNVDAA